MRTIKPIVLVFLLYTLPCVAGVADDVRAAAKSSAQGSLVRDVSVNGATATITYGSMGPNDWNGVSRERTAARVIPKVLQKVATIQKAIVVIEVGFRAVMKRCDAVTFKGALQNDTDFMKNVTDGVVGDKARLAEWEKRHVFLKK